MDALEPEPGRRSLRIAQGSRGQTFSPAILRTGSAAIPLGDFFSGSAPDKLLAAQVCQNRRATRTRRAVGGSDRGMGAHSSIGRSRSASGRIRLYAGYLGALFGYLPTAGTDPEGGYEVEGSSPCLGCQAHFDSGQIGAAVIGCVKKAIEDLERSKPHVIEPAPSPAP